MLLALEIYLAFTAWKKGWRAFSLFALGIGIIIGLLCVVATESIAAAIIGDVIAICALGYMALHTPEKMPYTTILAGKK